MSDTAYKNFQEAINHLEGLAQSIKKMETESDHAEFLQTYLTLCEQHDTQIQHIKALAKSLPLEGDKQIYRFGGTRVIVNRIKQKVYDVISLLKDHPEALEVPGLIKVASQIKMNDAIVRGVLPHSVQRFLKEDPKSTTVRVSGIQPIHK